MNHIAIFRVCVIESAHMVLSEYKAVLVPYDLAWEGDKFANVEDPSILPAKLFSWFKYDGGRRSPVVACPVRLQHPDPEYIVLLMSEEESRGVRINISMDGIIIYNPKNDNLRINLGKPENGGFPATYATDLFGLNCRATNPFIAARGMFADPISPRVSDKPPISLIAINEVEKLDAPGEYAYETTKITNVHTNKDDGWQLDSAWFALNIGGFVDDFFNPPPPFLVPDEFLY